MKKALANQTKQLIIDIVRICEGPEETQIVEALFKLRDDIIGFSIVSDEEWKKLVEESRYLVVKLVNEYFYSRLKILPKIIDYIELIKKKKSKEESKTSSKKKSKKKSSLN